MLLLSRDRNAIIETEYLTAHYNDPITGVAKIEQVIKYMVYIYKNDVQEYDYLEDDIQMAKRRAAKFGIIEWDEDYLTTDKYKKDPIVRIKCQFKETGSFQRSPLILKKGVAEELSCIEVERNFIDCIAIMGSELKVIPNEFYEIDYLLVNPKYSLQFIKPGLSIDLGTLHYEGQGTILEIRNV